MFGYHKCTQCKRLINPCDKSVYKFYKGWCGDLDSNGYEHVNCPSEGIKLPYSGDVICAIMFVGMIAFASFAIISRCL